MPISEEALESAKNRFIAVKGQAKVGQAIAALQAQNGQPWWHLLVQMSDGSWGITRFSELCQTLEDTDDAAEIRLETWRGLFRANAVARDSMETKSAQALARKSNGSLLVVTDGVLPAGILVESVNRSSQPAPPAKLGELCRKYVNLKDYGSILLACSKKSK